MASIALVGCTGLVGSNILNTVLIHPSAAIVSVFTRRAISQADDPNSKLRLLISSDSSTWPLDFSSISPNPSIFLSALGTSRARAGGVEAQRMIDYDLNLAMARAAKDAGAKIYVLISSSGVNKNSIIPYSKMKGELDEAVQQVGFEKTVLIKPGLIVGHREESRPAEFALRWLAGLLGRVNTTWLKDFWAQDADMIARAAVSAGLKCLDGSAPEAKTWVVGQSDIVRLGRTEWKHKP